MTDTAAPITRSERITNLDTVRGIATLGILVMTPANSESKIAPPAFLLEQVTISFNHKGYYIIDLSASLISASVFISGWLTALTAFCACASL